MARHREVMRIAVISDTHDRFPGDLPAQLGGADEIWHLGDVCAPTTLVEFEQLGPPLRVVRGNCDAHPWPLTLDLTRAGQRFHLVHIPPRAAPRGAEFLLHGHTHVPRDEADARGVRWLNPGCITRPNRGAPASFAWLTVAAGKPIGWELVRV
jgi:putative phosphoesterase